MRQYPMPMPIIINSHETRDCIVQDSKVYCHDDNPPTTREVGIMLLAVILTVVWLGYCLVQLSDSDNWRWLVFGICIPAILGILAMIYYGGPS